MSLSFHLEFVGIDHQSDINDGDHDDGLHIGYVMT